MLELRPNCECCNKDLPPDATDAMIYSFECPIPHPDRGYNAWQLTLQWQRCRAAHGDRQAERRHEGLRHFAAPQGGTLATFVTLASVQLALRRLARE
jgi:hypothetical protein